MTAALRHRNAVSAYDGKRLTGLVRQTWLRGLPADGEPAGRLLARTDEPTGRLIGSTDEPAGRLIRRAES
jgi:hypothetical protein